MTKENCVFYNELTERCDGFDCAFEEDDTCCYHCRHIRRCSGPCSKYKEDNST